jgi:aspartyl-tRNA(Asn)/glutamyl-tRNA(Gln) amidotransferase subunit A
MSNDLAFKTVAEIAPLIRKKQISPVTLVELYLSRIEKLNDVLHAYITVCAESALNEAKKREHEIANGIYHGPLHGIPIGLKDQFFTKDVPTTGGSRILAGFVSNEDSTTVVRLKNAGAIIIGKHNLSEFAMGGTRDHPYGTPRNPWDQGRIPGHSSSGSGIAVAAGMCAAALGEDTGGSSRIPAAACGIVALRPTYGRVSRHGVIPVCWSMDAVSPMARSVEDCAILLQTIAGHDLNDRMSSTLPVPDYRKELHQGIKGMRVGVIKELIPPQSADVEVQQLFQSGIEVFKTLGAHVHEVSIPFIAQAASFFVAICDTDAAHVHYDSIRSRPMEYDSATRARLMSASLISAGIYNKAQQARGLLRKQILTTLSNVDVLLSPMSNAPTPIIGIENPVFSSRDDVIKHQFGARSFTTFHSLAGLPALSIPCGFTSDGIPIGIQLGGRPFEEKMVLQMAQAYEATTEWHTRHPDI